MRIASAFTGGLILATMCFCAMPGIAQSGRSFDPAAFGACEKELGHGAESDAVIDDRSFELNCADEDLRRERAEFADLGRRENLAGAAERDTWEEVVRAFAQFRILHLEIFKKSCGGGNSCGADVDQAEAIANYQFLLMAEGFRGGAMPSGSAADLAVADGKLNADYRRALASEPALCTGNDDSCFPKELTRSMERAWLRYREGWVAYARIRWPQVPAESWRTYLTQQRLRLGGDGSGS
jgi:hypothetical protein